MEQMMLFNLEDDVETPVSKELNQPITAPALDNKELTIEVEMVPEIGDEVKIKLPANEDSETYQYLKYYCAHLLKKRGVITEVKLYPSGKYSCTIDYGDEQLVLNPEDFIILY